MPATRSTTRLVVAFVAGAGHSGSTLVSFVLNSNEHLFAIGEMHAPIYPKDRPEQRMCSCGATMNRCAFFAEISRRMNSEGLAFDPTSWDLQFQLGKGSALKRILTGSLRNTSAEAARDAIFSMFPPYRKARRRLEQQNVSFIRSALAITGARVFVDANKEPIRIHFLRRIPSIDLRVIHLVRDPRGYAHSRLRDRGVGAAEAARAWMRTNTNVDRLRRLLPEQATTRLRYEQLCAHPEEALARIGQFLGVGPVRVPDDFRKPPHHIMGNKMRLGSGGKPSTIRLDETWRKNLGARDLETIYSVTGRLAARYGFEL